MDRRELISVLREAFDKQVESHNALDMHSRELDYYLDCYIEKIEEVIGEREEKNNE